MEFGPPIIAVALTCLAGGGTFFTLANRATRRTHAKFGRIEVESALQCMLDDKQCHDAFDLFLAWPIDDPYLDSIRKRCREIVRTSAPAKPGEDISGDGKEQIRAILRDLRGHA